MVDKRYIEQLEKGGSDAIRSDFREVSPDNIHTLEAQEEKVWIVQAKWDGWFVALVVENGNGTMYSRKKRYRENLDCGNMPDGIYLGELIENTQWSYQFKNGAFHGKLMLFDIYDYDGDYIDAYQHLVRLLTTFPEWVDVVRLEKVEDCGIEGAFKKLVAEGYEGVIVTDVSLTVTHGCKVKIKRVIEDDFEIMGFEESTSDTAKKHGGMVAAIIYGKDGKRLGRCGSMPHDLKIDMYKNPDKYLGKVVVIRGKERFKSGALRHPAFDRFRDEADKTEA